MHPKKGHEKPETRKFWSEFAQLQAFIGKFRFFSEPWFVSCIFQVSADPQRATPWPSIARPAPKEVNDAL